MDIVEFLTARLDEDQRAAESDQEHWDAGAEVSYASGADFSPALSRMLLYRQFNPQRVLAEVAVKRQFVERFKYLVSRDFNQGRDPSNTDDVAFIVQDLIARETMLDVLRGLAGIYADHPDYEPWWGAK